MPRGKIKSADEKIRELDHKIEVLQSRINNLKAQKKELVENDRIARLQKVLQAAENRGMSIDDLLKKIEN